MSWNGLGYDIADFTIPERSQMKSNFLKVKAKPVPEPKAPAQQASIVEDVPKEAEIIILTEEERAAQKELEINRIIEKQVSS